MADRKGLPPAEDGWTADKLFGGSQCGYTYDDIIFMPGHVSFEAADVDMTGQLTRNIPLALPLIGGPVDTVTETNMATALALIGGIGFIHHNQSIDAQAEMTRRTKNFINGFIMHPVTMGPDDAVTDFLAIKEDRGFSGVPITDTGKLGGVLLGFVSSRETDGLEDRPNLKMSDVMVTKVVTGKDGTTLDEALEKLKKEKVGKLPIVDDQQRLTSMVTRNDIKKLRDHPNMSRDLNGKLLVGASVSANGRDDWDRASALVDAGVNVICVDPSNSANDGQLELIRKLKDVHSKVDIIAGPVTSCREAKRLMDSGADAIVVGGSPTQGHTAPIAGRTEATAMWELAKYVRQSYGCPVIAAGGIRNTGHIMKALGLGASAVMLCDHLAGTDEAPKGNVHSGDFGAYPAQATRHVMGPGKNKASRSRGSPAVSSWNQGSVVGGKGSAKALVPYLLHGVRCGMQDLGVQSIPDLHKQLEEGGLRMECQTALAAQSREACKQSLQRSAHAEVMPVLAA